MNISAASNFLKQLSDERNTRQTNTRVCVCVCVEYLYTCAARFVLLFIYNANVAYVLPCVCV